MEPNRSILFWCTLAGFWIPISGYKILIYCSFPSRSHYNLCRGTVDTLVDRGHNVSDNGRYFVQTVLINATFFKCLIFFRLHLSARLKQKNLYLEI